MIKFYGAAVGQATAPDTRCGNQKSEIRIESGSDVSCGKEARVMFILEVEAEEYRRMFFKADTTVDVFNLLNTLFKNVIDIKSVTVTQEKKEEESK